MGQVAGAATLVRPGFRSYRFPCPERLLTGALRGQRRTPARPRSGCGSRVRSGGAGCSTTRRIEGREFDLLDGAPGVAAADELGLVEPVHHLGHRVVIAVADGSRGGLCAEFTDHVRVDDCGVVRPMVGVADQALEVPAGSQAALSSARCGRMSAFNVAAALQTMPAMIAAVALPIVLLVSAYRRRRATASVS